MTEFWIAVAGLLGAAFIIVLWPWFKRTRIETSAKELDAEERARVNVRIFKDRMRELAAERAAGKINDEGFAALKDELEKTLILDVEQGVSDSDLASSKINEASNSSFVVLVAIAVSVCVCSFILYDRWGSYDQVIQYHDSRFNPQELALAEELAAKGDTRGLLVQLRDKLRNAPDNAEGWGLLARSAMNSENFDIAIESYDQLLGLETEPKTKAALFGLKAQALYFSQAAQAQVDESIENAFAIDPQELNSLGLLAIASYENEDYRSAISFWERTLSIAPDHPSRKSIEMGIQSARRALGEGVATAVEKDAVKPSATSNDTQNSTSDAGGSIKVELSIDDNVKSQLSGGEFLVVFAKANSGPPMPLAVFRSEVAAAPSSIRLDDTLAMMPALKLSLFEKVDVVARITKGTVERAVGDFEVVSQGVSLASGEETTVRLQLSMDSKVK